MSTVERVAPTRIVVVDDHPIVRQGLAELINQQDNMVCCAEAGSIAEAQRAILAHNPNLLVLDMRLGHTDGLEAIKSLRAQFSDLSILVISQFDETIYAERALRAGALGYVMKEQATEEVLRAIRTVVGGQIYVSPKVSLMAVQRLLAEKPAARESDLGLLTDRELHVFKAVGRGQSRKEIAADLNLSVKTVETYCEHIKYKLRLASAAELVTRARQVVEAESAGARKMAPDGAPPLGRSEPPTSLSPSTVP